MLSDLLLLFGLPFFAGVFAVKIKKPLKDQVQLLLAFSGAFLFSITVTHLIPGLFGDHHHGHDHKSEGLGLYILFGFLLQLFLDFLSKGVEHGHMHPPETKKKTFVFSIMTGLCLHAFIEGIPLGLEPSDFYPLLWGIILHKIPAAFVLGLLLSGMQIRLMTTLIMVGIFCLMSPLSLFGGQIFQSYEFLQEMTLIFLAVVCGSFLHISTTILLESGSNLHTISWLKLLAILAGCALATLFHFI
jgi:zinc transporter ZupT